MAGDRERFNRFFHAMLDAGVYLAPSAFEAGFVSAAHKTDDIAATIAAAEAAFRQRLGRANRFYSTAGITPVVWPRAFHPELRRHRDGSLSPLDDRAAL